MNIDETNNVSIFQLKPVRANRKVSKYAQSWANYLNNNDLFEHRTQKKYGENLSWMSGNVNGNNISLYTSYE